MFTQLTPILEYFKKILTFLNKFSIYTHKSFYETFTFIVLQKKKKEIVHLAILCYKMMKQCFAKLNTIYNNIVT